jgi:hypothetical protein
MSYTITVTNHSPITIATGATDSSTSLTLIGKNVPNYGQTIAQDLVNMMQNFAGTSEPNGIVTGQLWYDTTTNILKIYNGSSFTRIATTTVSASQPTNSNVGDLWWDGTNQQLNVYSGSSWVIVGPAVAVTGAMKTDTIADNTNINHEVSRVSLNNTNVAVYSSSAFTAKTSYAGITSIPNGVYIFANQTIGGNLTVNGQIFASGGIGGQVTGDQNINGNLIVQKNMTVQQNLVVTGTASLTASSAKYADLAENYQSDAAYEVGTVVMIGGEKEVTIANELETTKVAGVVSDKPAYIMNSDCPGLFVPVALQGRVPCKVIGNITKGDLLVAGIKPGVASASQNPKPGSIIGKSLENYNSSDVGIIEIMVGKH